MERWAAPGGGILSLDLGDLTQARVDAIVNAAKNTVEPTAVRCSGKLPPIAPMSSTRTVPAAVPSLFQSS